MQKGHSDRTNRIGWPQVALAALLILLLLTIFNVYYFFVRRDVGLGYYIERLFAEDYTAVAQEPFYRAMTEAYLHFNLDLGHVPVHVFIGDSITAGFNLHEFGPSGSRRVLNRGIYSDTTDGLFRRIGINANNLMIEKLFVMIGYNDLHRKADDEIVANIEKILDLAKAERKYLQSILPVDPRIDARKNARIVAVNRALREMCVRKGWHFIDLHDSFEKNGGMNPHLTYDGIHPNYFGYRMWYSVIRPYLHEE